MDSFFCILGTKSVTDEICRLPPDLLTETVSNIKNFHKLSISGCCDFFLVSLTSIGAYAARAESETEEAI